MTAIIYPDIEKIIVAFLKAELDSLSDPLAANVRVATKKAAPDLDQPAKQVVVVGAYDGTLDGPLRSANLVLDVYAADYDTASSLALLVAALIVQCIGDPIKRAVVTVGPVRLTDETPEEKRSISVDLTVKGSHL
jgi:hypothetical protein